ncbi:MAG TPA: IS3 family transposase, partial [Chloroflexota bacterium]|nr:IS3 family transposase [Chloroflexota bacterium]
MLAPEQQLRFRLKEISKDWPRYGFRRAWALLRQEGWKVNKKRVQRIWREEGLRVPVYAPKRRRVGESTVPAARLRAERPNHVWALDFLFDATSDGRPIKVLSMCDEFTRESIGGYLGRSITADDVVLVLDEALSTRGAPEFIRCDNG